MPDRTVAHYISGTHWDREWYRPFQEYRVLLVRLMDGLLDLMESSDSFRYFQLDGQTCILDDYLEIRPENRPRLQRLISEGRILIGPWFTMPDLFCPDEESLIRNLLMGRRISANWGVEAMPVGFICDMFGHPSQMPQLFGGFGIEDIVLGRGTNEHSAPMYFTWESPDGSSALVYKLQDRQGYGAFALPRAIIEDQGGVAGEQLPCREAYMHDMRQAGGDPELIREVQEKYGKAELAAYVQYEAQRANLPVIAVMDSMDHIAPAGDVARYLRLIHEGCPEVDADHSTLPHFFADVRRELGDAELQRLAGELREPSRESCPYLYLIPYCVSARIRMKQAADASAALLERWVEPLLAFGASAADVRELHAYLPVAWKQILLNHAHDSICGCSIDQVHRDMMYRFDQARVLGEQLRHQAFGTLTAGCAELARHEHEFTLSLWNPLPVDRTETVIFDIDLPMDFPTTFHEGFRTQELKAFELEDAAGNRLPCQLLGFVPRFSERSHVAKFSFIQDGAVTRYTVAMHLALPASGFTSLRVVPASRPVRYPGSLRTGPTTAENEYIGIAIQADGTLTMTDRLSGQTYRDLLTFEDRSEVGDGWFHGHSLNDRVILSTAGRVQIAVLHEGPEVVTFRIDHHLDVPRRYDWHAEAPGTETVDLHIRNEVTLRRGARTVDVSTIVENVAEDHRLQLLLPTDVPADSYSAHTPFDLVERSIAVDASTANWQEMEIVEKPFHSLQALAAGERGLAFISGGGLHEGGVRDDHRRTMQVTLLRSFRRTIGTEGERDGLELGTIRYRYALMPFQGPLPAADALRVAQSLESGLLTRQTGSRPSGYPKMQGSAPPHRRCLAQTTGELVVSAIKPTEQEGEGIVIRLWNPGNGPASDTLTFDRAIAAAALVRLDETQPQPLPHEEYAVSISLAAKAIATLCISLA